MYFTGTILNEEAVLEVDNVPLLSTLVKSLVSRNISIAGTPEFLDLVESQVQLSFGSHFFVRYYDKADNEYLTEVPPGMFSLIIGVYNSRHSRSTH